MVMRAQALLERNPHPTEPQIRDAHGAQPVPLRHAYAHPAPRCSRRRRGDGRRAANADDGRALAPRACWRRRRAGRLLRACRAVAAASRAARRRRAAAARQPEGDAAARRLDPGRRRTGAVTVFTGKAELGQGLKTALLQSRPSSCDCAGSDHADHRRHRRARRTRASPPAAIRCRTAAPRSLQRRRAGAQPAGATRRRRARRAAPSDAHGAEDGAVHAPDGRSLGYGALAAGLSLHVAGAAGQRAERPRRRIGCMGKPMPRVDIPAKVTGGAAYVQDMRLPGHAARARGAPARARRRAAASSTPTPVEKMPGVVKVVRDGNYLAVVAARRMAGDQGDARAGGGGALGRSAATLPDQADHPRHAAGAAGARHRDPATGRRRPARRRSASRRATRGPTRCTARSGRPARWRSSQDGAHDGVDAHAGRLPAARRARRVAAACRRSRCAASISKAPAATAITAPTTSPADAALIARARAGPAGARAVDARAGEHRGAVRAGDDRRGRGGARRRRARSSTGTTRSGATRITGGPTSRRAVAAECGAARAAAGAAADADPACRKAAATATQSALCACRTRVSSTISCPRCRCASRRCAALGAYINVFSIESFMDELAQAAQGRSGRVPAAPSAGRAGARRDPDGGRASSAGRSGRAEPGHGRGFAFARYKNLGAYCADRARVCGRARDRRGSAWAGSWPRSIAAQPINPDGIRNQIEGAIVQSASWTLYEAVAFRPPSGSPAATGAAIRSCAFRRCRSSIEVTSSTGPASRSWAPARRGRARPRRRSPTRCATPRASGCAICR